MNKVAEEQYRAVMHKAMDLSIDNYNADFVDLPFSDFSVLRNIHLTKEPKNFCIYEGLRPFTELSIDTDSDNVGIGDKTYIIAINYCEPDHELGSYPWKDCELEIFGHSNPHGKEGQLDDDTPFMRILGFRMDYERNDVPKKSKITEFYLTGDSFDALTEIMEDYLSRYREGLGSEPDGLELSSVKRKYKQPIGFVDCVGDDI